MTNPSFAGIHHLKLAVTDLGDSLAFYEAALGARRIAEFDHVRDGAVFAYILAVPGLGTMLELRLDPDNAAKQHGFNFLTLTVERRADLDAWVAHLAAIGADHSSVLTGVVGWLVAFADPDGKHVRLYTRETHGPELPVTWDSPWIK
jgi:catechol 2,3-dioxygenase-like lactoylglutathione lyase family enzyme